MSSSQCTSVRVYERTLNVYEGKNEFRTSCQSFRWTTYRTVATCISNPNIFYFRRKLKSNDFVLQLPQFVNASKTFSINVIFVFNLYQLLWVVVGLVNAYREDKYLIVLTLPLFVDDTYSSKTNINRVYYAICSTKKTYFPIFIFHSS